MEGNIQNRSLDRAAGKVTRLWAGCWRIHGLIHGRDKAFFFLSKASRGSSWFTHPPLPLTPEAIPLVAERLVREAGQYSCTPPHVLMAWCLIKHRGRLTLLFCEALGPQTL